MTWTSDEPGNPLPLVVSFFTRGFYEREAFDLARSCQLLGVPFRIECVSDLGGWESNTNHKPTHLKRLHAELPGRAMVWIDADARFRRVPTLLMAPIPGGAVVGYRTIRGRPASGTVLLPVHKRRGELLEKWEEVVRNHPNATDQVCLGWAVSALMLPHVELPAEYCWIYDFTRANRRKPDPSPTDGEEPVIEHMQASRWARKREQ